jgi:hypothetical protein
MALIGKAKETLGRTMICNGKARNGAELISKAKERRRHDTSRLAKEKIRKD